MHRLHRIVRLAFLLATPVAPACAQNPTTAFPNNYKLLLDNPEVAVLRAHYGPHETVGVHDHSAFSTVYVYLNDSGPVRFTHSEAHPFSIVRPPTHTGAFRVSPGRLERHSVENLSDLPSDYLRVELKHLPVKALLAEFRGPAPTLPLTAGATIVYDNPRLRIERIVCLASQPCVMQEEKAPSALIAITPTSVAIASTMVSLTFDHPVAWIPGGRAVTVEPPVTGVLDLLRIELPGPARK